MDNRICEQSKAERPDGSAYQLLSENSIRREQT
jgi:hypothetical protein